MNKTFYYILAGIVFGISLTFLLIGNTTYLTEGNYKIVIQGLLLPASWLFDFGVIVSFFNLFFYHVPFKYIRLLIPIVTLVITFFFL